MTKPPIRCIPCRVTIGGNRYRIYEDGSVSSALTLDEHRRLGFKTLKEGLDYEATQLTRP